MNRILSAFLNALELVIPIAGITRLGASRAASVLLATCAHLVPIMGCAFAGWDPVTLLLAYWIDLALVLFILLAVLIVFIVFRFLVAKSITGEERLKKFPVIAWWGRDREWGRLANKTAVLLPVWFGFAASLMFGCMQMLLEIAQSHYGLESLSAAFGRLAGGFVPPDGGIIAFLDSESASLALMLLSSAVFLGVALFEKNARRADWGMYLFTVKPMVQIITMLVVLGCAMQFGPGRLHAVATVAIMALAMMLIEQRAVLIEHDFRGEVREDARFRSPHGALLNFGLQVFLLIISASFLMSSVFVKQRYDRIMKHPVEVQGVIIEARPPDDEGMTIDGGYFWLVDVQYPASDGAERRFVLRDIKVHVFSASEPKGWIVKVVHEAGNPRNAFVDVPEDRGKPAIFLVRGIIAMVLGVGAWWAVGRFLHG